MQFIRARAPPRRQPILQRIGQSLGARLIEDPGRDVAKLQARLHQGLLHGGEREPAQMRAVENAAVLIVERAVDELENDTPMRDVRNADEHDAARAEQRRMLPHDAPGIAQMLQHVAIDDAVVAARHLEGQRVGLDVEAGGFRQPGGRHPDGVHVVVDADDARPGIPPPVDRPQHALVATDIEDDVGIERDTVEKVRIEDVRVVGRRSQGVRQGQIQSSRRLTALPIPGRPHALRPFMLQCMMRLHRCVGATFLCSIRRSRANTLRFQHSQEAALWTPLPPR
jgi:hypothetical protein